MIYDQNSLIYCIKILKQGVPPTLYIMAEFRPYKILVQSV